MKSRLLLGGIPVVVASLALFLVGLGAAAEPAAAGGFTTLPGFNSVKPVFQGNGFTFKATYIRCYSDPAWRKVRRGHVGLMGWYDGGVWIHVRAATCNNAIKLLNGQLNYTTAVALSTLMHETIHRQGVRDEATTECLSQFMTGHVVRSWTGSAHKARLAMGYAGLFAERRLPSRYQMSISDCGAVADAQGIQLIAEDRPPTPPKPSAPPTPPRPPATPAPPAPPAEATIGSDAGTFPSVSGDAAKGHREVVVYYSTVGPYDIRINAYSGYTAQRVQGVGSFVLPLAGDTVGLPYVMVSASPDLAWSSVNLGQSKAEIRVVTR